MKWTITWARAAYAWSAGARRAGSCRTAATPVLRFPLGGKIRWMVCRGVIVALANAPPHNARQAAKRCGACTDIYLVPAELGPTRPDRLTIWPVEGDAFGIDVRWGGAVGNKRATVVARLLADAGIRGRLTQSLDGAWEVRVGPVPGTEVARVIDQFVW